MQANSALQKAEALLPKLTEQETDILLNQIFNLRKQSGRKLQKRRAFVEGEPVSKKPECPYGHWSTIV